MDTDGLNATEAECAAGRTAPRVSLDDIKANIAGEHFFRASEALNALQPGADYAQSSNPLAVLTICLVVLRNGFTIIGKSAPADARNFDEELGRKLAYEDAVRQVWPLMGYALRDRLDFETALAAKGTPPTLPDQATYVGTKVLHAKPMTRAEWCELRDWRVPDDEDGTDAGYMVEYTDGGPRNVAGFNGYVSWSPAAVFERAYRPLASR